MDVVIKLCYDDSLSMDLLRAVVASVKMGEVRCILVTIVTRH